MYLEQAEGPGNMMVMRAMKVGQSGRASIHVLLFSSISLMIFSIVLSRLSTVLPKENKKINQSMDK